MLHTCMCYGRNFTSGYLKTLIFNFWSNLMLCIAGCSCDTVCVITVACVLWQRETETSAVWEDTSGYDRFSGGVRDTDWWVWEWECVWMCVDVAWHVVRADLYGRVRVCVCVWYYVVSTCTVPVSVLKAGQAGFFFRVCLHINVLYFLSSSQSSHTNSTV